jgi:predicted nucleotidyltransferase
MNPLAEKREIYARKLDEAKQHLVHVLSQMPGVERIILFGSYSRGRKDLLTDLDVLVILRTSLGFLERLKSLYQSLTLPVDLDLICLTPEELEAVKEKPFFKKILEEGIVLYEKGRA